MPRPPARSRPLLFALIIAAAVLMSHALTASAAAAPPSSAPAIAIPQTLIDQLNAACTYSVRGGPVKNHCTNIQAVGEVVAPSGVSFILIRYTVQGMPSAIAMSRDRYVETVNAPPKHLQITMAGRSLASAYTFAVAYSKAHAVLLYWTTDPYLAQIEVRTQSLTFTVPASGAGDRFVMVALQPGQIPQQREFTCGIYGLTATPVVRGVYEPPVPPNDCAGRLRNW